MNKSEQDNERISRLKSQAQSLTDQGCDYYKLICPDIVIEEGKRWSNTVQHPYLPQAKDFFIFCGKDGIWWFRYDLDGKEYKGDMVDLEAGFSELDVEKDIERIIYNINHKLNLGLQLITGPETPSGSEDEYKQDTKHLTKNTSNLTTINNI